MPRLPRPKGLPFRVPAWAWTALKLPRRFVPRHKPAWFWVWRRWRLGQRLPALTRRQKVVKWALWGVKHTGQFSYSEGPDRSGWLSKPKGHLPIVTDCSGFVTMCYWAADADDPNGLNYKQVGYTGTLLEHAQKVGRVSEDLSLARPGDLIVIGPGTGLHVVVCINGGPNPLVVSHGSQPVIQELLSADPRTPKRVCKTLR